MSKILITGSADGLGQMAAKLLVDDGHEVILHGRNKVRAQSAIKEVPGAAGIVIGDFSSMEEIKRVAEQANQFGSFDAIIHNAAVGYKEQKRINTVDGLAHLFAINSLAPYILTCLIKKPERLIYLSSGLHLNGDASLKDLPWNEKPWLGFQAYADSKLHNILLAFAIARKWPDVYANAVSPGWVATKMGGSGAPDSLEDAPKTQAWLAVSNEKAALVSGEYFYHQKVVEHHAAANDVSKQDLLLAEYEKLSGIKFPVFLERKILPI